MKKYRIMLALLLALAMTLSLCACGGGGKEAASDGGAIASAVREAADEKLGEDAPEAPEAEDAAGVYTFYCAHFGPAYAETILEMEGTESELDGAGSYYVDFPDMEGETVTLEADGTGYLYWGEDNQGPIDRWTREGDVLRFQAGVSDFEATLIDGFMTVELGEDIAMCFAAEGVTPPGINPISLDDYVQRMYDLAMGEDETAPAEDLPLEGVYTVFAAEEDGFLVDAGELELDSVLTLEEGGTGNMTMDEDSMGITSWTVTDGVITIVMEDEGTADAAVRGGVLELDVFGTGELILYYAREGADISAYDPMTLDEYLEAIAGAVPDSRVYALWEELDAADGVHLSYDRHTDYLDADQSYDVHSKDGVYYSLCTTYVSGFEEDMVTFFRDGTAYNLYPEDMSGIVATTTTSQVIAENILLMDDLYSEIWTHATETEYTVETREVDGAAYTVEVFPESEYTSAAAFYFDDAGQLVRCVSGPPVVDVGVDIGESVYVIHAIDDAVDEGLFDISGYDIAEP